MTPFKFLALLFLLGSCRSYKALEARSLPVTFQADSSSFREINEEIYCDTLLGILPSLSKELRLGKKTTFWINRPTNFQIYHSEFIVYPGDKIVVGLNKDGNPIFTAKENEQRNRELLFEAAFQNHPFKNVPQVPPRIKSYPIDSILFWEQKLKEALPNYLSETNELFDSLAAIYRVSNSFRNLYKKKLEQKKYSLLHWFYIVYTIELRQHNIYLQKKKTLLPFVSKINDRDRLHLSADDYIESLAIDLIPTYMRQLETDDKVREALHTVNANFKGLSKDFLLTKIMYQATCRQIPASKKLRRYYFRSCKDKQYESVVRNLLAEQRIYTSLNSKN